tara:strand:+ start:1373 stop:1681 length:309 start_codon:yes stop_codon:yes gene_type:complete
MRLTVQGRDQAEEAPRSHDVHHGPSGRRWRPHVIDDAGGSFHQDIDLIRRLTGPDDNFSRSIDLLLGYGHQSLEMFFRELLANLQILYQWVTVRSAKCFHCC